MKTKTIIFFDGDGTLWYPKKTKRTIAPHWIYRDAAIGEKYLDHMVLTPSAITTLKKLKKTGSLLIILSTHPQPKKEADVALDTKIRHFKLETLFDEVHTARAVPTGKGKVIEQVLKRRRIQKSKALMVGDNYEWDYLAARRIGVDALVLQSDYLKHIPKIKSGSAVIENLLEIASKYTLQSPTVS